jgi:hypothetical protein
MADSLRYANDEFEKMISFDKVCKDIERGHKYYYFLLGFKSGMEFEMKDGKETFKKIMKSMRKNGRK